MIRYPSFIIVFLIVFVAISLYQVKHFVSQKELALKIFSSGFKKNPSSSILLDTLTRLKISVDQLRK